MPEDPWSWYIYLHECLIFYGINVGKYDMDLMAKNLGIVQP